MFDPVLRDEKKRKEDNREYKCNQKSQLVSYESLEIPGGLFLASVFSLIPIPTSLLSTDESLAISHLNRFSLTLLLFPRPRSSPIRSKPALPAFQETQEHLCHGLPASYYFS